MRRLEREVLNIEEKEQEKIHNSGLPLLKDTYESKIFEYSSLNMNVTEEFKEAKWVVLTSPVILK